MNLAQRKKNRKAAKARIAEQLATVGQSKYGKNENSWYPATDKNKNGIATIRFLPEHENMDLPWVEIWTHGFKGPTNKWFIHQCRTSIKGNCAVCVNNNENWDDLSEEDQKARKRNHYFYTNVLIVDDPKNPENNGKVKEFRFGQQIFDMIQEAGREDEFDPDKVIVDAFCPWDGSDFQLRVCKDDRGWTSYKKSKFLTAKKIGTDAEIEKVLDQMFDLNDLYLDEKNFLTEEEESKKLALVLGNTNARVPTQTAAAPVTAKTAEAKPAVTSEVNESASLDDIDDLFAD